MNRARVEVLSTIEGGEELRRALRKVREEFMAECRQAIPEEAQALMAQAQAAAPRGSGTLAASAEVSKTKGGMKAAAAFLDEKAAAVHEGIHWGHRIEGTQGFKWYERILAGFEAGFVSRMAARLRRLVGG